MMSILLSMNTTMTILFLMMKHPLSMGMTLLIQTTIISLMTTKMNSNSWFSYILFLIMIGGMLILFMYMTSIASNEKFKTNMKMIFITPTIPVIIIATKNSMNSSLSNSEMEKMNLFTEMNMTMNKYINFPLSMTLVFLMMYLLLALIATVKITEFKQGSIRQMN
uniref:NADH dehydrogenase subunit 6 n=1 Tax=Strongylium pinfaense TaxID=2969968 RepID=UPI002176B672|nr:NADH dehydrogenase subunit 6 [Strongylium pinfaense]UUL71610.1 NADH dehydrogenase subunit 6 [Strongylium pinfaense]